MQTFPGVADKVWLRTIHSTTNRTGAIETRKRTRTTTTASPRATDRPIFTAERATKGKIESNSPITLLLLYYMYVVPISKLAHRHIRQDDFPQFSELNAPPPQSDDPSYVNLEDFDAGQKCQVSDWGPWSDCSSSCDTGAQTRWEA